VGRQSERHIDNEELNALAPSAQETGERMHGLSPDAVREAESHVHRCADCHKKVSIYRQLVNRVPSVVVSQSVLRRADCPEDEDVDWHEVAAGLWPELKAKQLIMHAALCDYCGPRLRAATSVYDEPTPQEERLLAVLKEPTRPDPIPAPVPPLPRRWRFAGWLVPVAALALAVIVGVLGARPPATRAALSGPEFAEFAVNTHRQFAQGSLALDIHSDSQQMLNKWFKERSQFGLTLPASPAAPGEERRYHLQGARMVQVSGKTAAYIAYEMQTGPVGLMVAPDSVAVASGGVQSDFNKLSFHYVKFQSYRVVSWSNHGLTYALVSQEGNRTQQSCMVCHSAMRDRDLSQTPTPLREQ
jgi:anti-sigma factor RsiW